GQRLEERAEPLELEVREARVASQVLLDRARRVEVAQLRLEQDARPRLGLGGEPRREALAVRVEPRVLGRAERARERDERRGARVVVAQDGLQDREGGVE